MEFQASQFRKSSRVIKSPERLLQKVLTAHVNKALEVFADMMQENPEGSEEGSENGDNHESTDGHTDEEGEAVEGAE